MIEITTPVGRLVGGHPMVARPQKDDKTGLPKMQADNVTPQVQYYCAIAIPKGTEQHWNQTEWGAKIWAEALAAWPGGEYQQGAFSWKISDGDDTVPNKKMRKNCDREGYPGHWVIRAANGFPIKSYHLGRYSPTDEIQQKEAIKAGDYCRLVFTAKGNGATGTNTPGIYINPSKFELYQAGIKIELTDESSAEDTFGAVQGALPAGAQVDPNIQAQTATPNQATPGVGPDAPGGGPDAPATDYLNPAAGGPTPTPTPTPTPAVEKFVANDGIAYTREELVGFNFTPEQINALPRA